MQYVQRNFTIKGLRFIHLTTHDKSKPQDDHGDVKLGMAWYWIGYGTGEPIVLQECAVHTFMSVKMATDLTKPLDFIASGVFSEEGPTFHELFPMTPAPLSVFVSSMF